MSHEENHPKEKDPSLKTLIKEEEILEELLEEIDLEIYAKEGKKPVKAKRYRIKIDAAYFIVHQKEMTGRAILLLAGKNPPENFILTLKTRGHEQDNGDANEFLHGFLLSLKVKEVSSHPAGKS
jgi:predicted ribosome quality control (RQC) complex YloA/Tae2 family protein